MSKLNFMYIFLRVKTFVTSNGRNWIVYIHRRKVEKFRRTSQITYPSVLGLSIALNQYLLQRMAHSVSSGLLSAFL